MHNPNIPFKQPTIPSPAHNPSFSSTLLDQIYRSIDDRGLSVREERLGSFGRIVPSSVMDKCRDNYVLDSRMQGSSRCFFRELDTKNRDLDIDHDATYFSSTSISSDSSYGGFSSSDNDSFHGARTKTSCFAPLKLRPVKTHAVTATTEKEGHVGGSAPFDGDGEEGVVPKSRASKVYETLKKVRQQPVSAGGRLTSMLNSIFASSSTKKKGRSKDDASFERKSKSGQGPVSICASSATSFSRTYLNGSFSSRSAAREDLRDGTGTRSVRFFSPVNVMVGEDHPRRPCSRTFQRNDAEDGKEFGSGRSRIVAKNLAELKKKWDRDEERNWVHETKRLQDIIGRNQATPKVIAADLVKKSGNENEDEDDDDGAGSCSSSDLFEIDHLAMIGDDRNGVGLLGNKNDAVSKKLDM